MKKIIIGSLCAAAIVAVIGCLGIWFWLFREQPTLGATLSVPSEVETGSTVTMTVTTTNSQKKSVTLDSIDIDDSFLTGFQVVTIDPEPTDTLHIGFLHQRSWNFGNVVRPGSGFVVTFTLKAVSEGHFVGDVDVCNPNQDFKTLLADVVVTGKNSSKTGAANGSEPIHSQTNQMSDAAGPRH